RLLRVPPPCPPPTSPRRWSGGHELHRVGQCYPWTFSSVLAWRPASSEPAPGIELAAGRPIECGAEFGHGVEIVDGAELVHEGQHGADAARTRLEAVEAEQRVEP